MTSAAQAGFTTRDVVYHSPGGAPLLARGERVGSGLLREHEVGGERGAPRFERGVLGA